MAGGRNVFDAEHASAAQEGCCLALKSASCLTRVASARPDREVRLRSRTALQRPGQCRATSGLQVRTVELTEHTRTAMHFATVCTGARFEVRAVGENLVEISCRGVGLRNPAAMD